MSLATDLMGLGMPPEQGARLGYSALTTIAGVGTAQVGGAAIPNGVNNVLATATAGQTAFALPSTAELNVPYLFTNGSVAATAALIFPPSGGNINGVGANASVSVNQNLARIFIRLSDTRWISFLAA